MKRKSFFIGLGIACFVLIVSGSFIFIHKTSTPKIVRLKADYPAYDSLESLVDTADTIVEGKVIGYRYSRLNISQDIQLDNERHNPGGEKDNGTIPYTVYTVEIMKTYKGILNEKDEIQVKTLGGIIGNTEYVLSSDDTKLEKGKSYLLFLETYLDSPASLLNPTQASYEYDLDGSIITNKQGTQTEQNKISFRIEDLENIINRKE